MFRDINQDDYDKQATVVVRLPPIIDSNPDGKVNITIMPLKNYISLNEKTREVSIDLGKVPASDYKFMTFIIKLTDS